MQEQSNPRRWLPFAAYGLVVVAAGLIGFSVRGLFVADRPPADGAMAAEAETGWSAPSAPAAFDPLEPTPAATAAEPAAAETVVVYISGAVAQPDTYQLPAEARFSDVVRLAGGLTDEADRDRVNLSERVHDAQHIHIPRIGEQATDDGSEGAQARANDGRIDLNSATLSDLDGLPRIGKVLAQRIIDWRTSNGPFATTDDIQQVAGVTPSIYAEIKDKITVQ